MAAETSPTRGRCARCSRPLEAGCEHGVCTRCRDKRLAPELRAVVEDVRTEESIVIQGRTLAGG